MQRPLTWTVQKKFYNFLQQTSKIKKLQFPISSTNYTYTFETTRFCSNSSSSSTYSYPTGTTTFNPIETIGYNRRKDGVELPVQKVLPPSDWRENAKEFLNTVNNCAIEELEDKYIPVKRSKNKSSAVNVRHFVDYRRLRVVGGDGGDGCISFLSLFIVERAGPDGADGGSGGHVVFKGVKGPRSLDHIDSYIKAQNGSPGQNKDCTGKNAQNLIIEVPVGTIFKYNKKIVGSLDEEGELFVAARGGAGGKGNAFFTTDVDQAPRIAEFGGKGENLEYEVELRTMADVGLIGFPNAGKSTLLRAVSRARPKVASYPFTTLNPYVGIIHYADLHQLAVADIPGIIQGAHRNHGLGLGFLKHIERCECLLYVIDTSQPEPWRQFDVLRSELEHYQEGLSTRPHLLIANKMDLPNSKENLEKLRAHTQLPVVGVSAKMGDNLLPLMALLRMMVDYKTSTTND